jgi:hypothetical protein
MQPMPMSGVVKASGHVIRALWNKGSAFCVDVRYMITRDLLRRLSAAGLMIVASAASPLAQTRQTKPGDPLYQTIASLDRALFDAYNTCDLDKFSSLIADDVEFYHDVGGFIRTSAAVADAVKKNICGKTRRDHVPGTLEVHPMDGYGALQIGVHRFCDTSLKQCDGTTGGLGRYAHLWQNRDGSWKITRIYSYDHVPAK